MINTEQPQKALVIIETNTGLGGNLSTVWILLGHNLLIEAFESDPGAIRVSGPIPSKDAEMIGSQIVVAMQRLGISADKAYTIDD